MKRVGAEYKVLRVAIVGCGKIADQHIQTISRIADCRIVSLCDRELLMAKQLGERFGVLECFSDSQEMLRATTPDVVHITTPPQNHFSLARQCLEFASHVYLEKPFTITAEEAKSLIQLADRRDLKITAGHNLQFTPEMLKMRRLVQQGFLGGKPVGAASDGRSGRVQPRIFRIGRDHVANRSADALEAQATGPVPLSKLPKHDEAMAERTARTGVARTRAGRRRAGEQILLMSRSKYRDPTPARPVLPGGDEASGEITNRAGVQRRVPHQQPASQQAVRQVGQRHYPGG